MAQYQPGHYLAPAARNATRARAAARKASSPKWMENDDRRVLTFGVYAMYLQHYTYPEIMAAWDLKSPSQVSNIVRRAREFQAAVFTEDLRNILVEQIATRREIVREMYTTLHDLRSGYAVGPSRAEAELKILMAVNKAEERIELLLRLNEVSFSDEDEASEPATTDTAAPAQYPVVIDMSSYGNGTYGVSNSN